MYTRLQKKRALVMDNKVDNDVSMDTDCESSKILLSSLRERLNCDSQSNNTQLNSLPSLRSCHTSSTRETRRRTLRTSRQMSTSDCSSSPKAVVTHCLSPTDSMGDICSPFDYDNHLDSSFIRKSDQVRSMYPDPNNNISKADVIELYNSHLNPSNDRLDSLDTSTVDSQSLLSSNTSCSSPLMGSPSVTKRCSGVVPKSLKGLSNRRCRVTKRSKGSRMRKVKRQEYIKLRQMVPSLQEKNRVSKVVVIEEAIKYIDELHSTLVQRFRAKDVPTTFNGVLLDPQEIHRGNIRELVRKLLANANPGSLPPARIENVRNVPSFIQKLSKHKK